VIPHQRPSHLGNPWTVKHIGAADGRYNHIRDNYPEWARRHDAYGKWYWSLYRERVHERYRHINRYWHNDQFRYYYSGWYRHGFCGGFYYPVRTVRIETYFHYPVITWLYAPTYEDDYWKGYYNGTWDPDDSEPRYPVVRFPYAGIFFPTDTIKDLAAEVSGMPRALQYRFRTSMISFVDQLKAAISDQLQAPIKLGQYEVIVNHYQNLNNEAIVLEGFVDKQGAQYAFKALLDLVNPSRTMVFVPTSQDPDGSNQAVLDAINARIVQLGGDPYTVDQEPTDDGHFMEDMIADISDVQNM